MEFFLIIWWLGYWNAETGCSTFTQSVENPGINPAMHLHQPQNQIIMVRSFLFRFDGISIDMALYVMKESIFRKFYFIFLYLYGSHLYTATT